MMRRRVLSHSRSATGLLVGILLLMPEAVAAEPAQWSVRVCPVEGGAAVKVSVGLPGSRNLPGRRAWKTFARSTKPQSAVLPSDFDDESGVWVAVDPGSPRARANVCVLRGAEPIHEFIEFGRREAEVTVNQSGDCAC